MTIVKTYVEWLPSLNTLQVDVDNGKYAFILGVGSTHVLRYGDAWVTIERGTGAIRMMACELAQARDRSMSDDETELILEVLGVFREEYEGTRRFDEDGDRVEALRKRLEASR